MRIQRRLPVIFDMRIQRWLPVILCATTGPACGSTSSSTTATADAVAGSSSGQPVGAPLSFSPAGPTGKGTPQTPITEIQKAALARLIADTHAKWHFEQGQLTASGDSGIPLPANERPSTVALRFLSKYSDLFGFSDVSTELVFRRENANLPNGAATAYFEQVEAGIPVLQSSVTVLFGPRRQLVSIGSTYVASAHGFSSAPTLSLKEATARAEADARHRFSGLHGRSLIVIRSSLAFSRVGAGAKLVYRLGVGAEEDGGGQFSAKYIVDANTGDILGAGSGVVHAVGGSPADETSPL
jgi:hypothetical protein